MPFMRLLFGIHLSLRTIVCTTLVWAYVGSMIAKGDLARGVVYHDKNRNGQRDQGESGIA